MSAAASSFPPRKPLKAKITNEQHSRRDKFLKRQKDARFSLTNHSRNSIVPQIVSKNEELENEEGGDDSSAGASIEGISKKELKLLKKREHWSKQLCTPEWMVEIPNNLKEDWFVLPRPEGKRVILIAHNSKTIARTLSGSILFIFQSLLPGGHRSSNRSSNRTSTTILDCIFHEADFTFYCLDMLFWNDYSLYDSTSDFRHYWVQTKLPEQSVLEVNIENEYSIKPVPCFDCDASGLEKAYLGRFCFIKDGLVFVCKEASYPLGVTPLILIWKDESITRYPVVAGDEQQSVVLEARKCSVDSHQLVECLSFVTSDDPPIKLFESCKRGKLRNAKQGELFRFSVESVGYAEDIDNKVAIPSVSGIKVEKQCSKVRPAADSWSKIVAQSALRSGGVNKITIQDIANKVK